jgi:hypothetical protein
MEFWIAALGVTAVTVYLLWRSRRGTTPEHELPATAGRPDDLRDKNSGLRDATHRKEGIANAGVPPTLPGPGFGGGSPGG